MRIRRRHHPRAGQDTGKLLAGQPNAFACGGGGRHTGVMARRGIVWIALAWLVGILVVAYGFAMLAYRRKIS